MLPKKKRARSKKYLAFVRTLPCCHCLVPGPNIAHHEIGIGDGKIGGKAGDDRALPICARHHLMLHAATGETRDYWIGSQDGWVRQTQKLARKAGVKVPT